MVPNKDEVRQLALISFNTLVIGMHVDAPHLKNPFIKNASVKAGLFVTLKRNGRLRGCIGTFEPQPIVKGVVDYTFLAALKDPRFDPITASEVPKLSISVTILGPLHRIKDPLDWEIGKHGVRAEFPGGHSSTFLPDVMVEQKWTREETLDQLAIKAGVNSLKGIKVSIYEGIKSEVDFKEYVDVASRS